MPCPTPEGTVHKHMKTYLSQSVYVICSTNCYIIIVILSINSNFDHMKALDLRLLNWLHDGFVKSLFIFRVAQEIMGINILNSTSPTIPLQYSYQSLVVHNQ